MSINKGWYMGFHLYPPRRPARPSLRFFSEVKGNLNDEVWYTAQVHSHYHRYTIAPTQRVGDCTLLLSSAASLLQALAFYFRMHPGLFEVPRPPLVAVVGI